MKNRLFLKILFVFCIFQQITPVSAMEYCKDKRELDSVKKFLRGEFSDETKKFLKEIFSEGQGFLPTTELPPLFQEAKLPPITLIPRELPPITLKKTIKLFVGTLFNPFYELYEDEDNQIEKIDNQIKKTSIFNYLKNQVIGFGSHVREQVKEKPIDTIFDVATLALLGGVNNDVINAIYLVGKAKDTLEKVLSPLSTGEGELKLAMDLLGCGTAFSNIVTNVTFPGVEGYPYNSLAEAQNTYRGGTCNSEPYKSLLDSVVDCVEKGGGMKDCSAHIQENNVNVDLYVFTRHKSTSTENLDPVSIVQVDGGETCFYTALNKDSPVTKTCFSDLATDKRTVEKLEGITLMKTHEGLDPGKSVQHIGVTSNFRILGCGYFNPTDAVYNVGDKTICTFTSLVPGGDVTQMCFDQNHPEQLTIKKVDGISLNFESDGKPVSIVVRNPSEMGLNPYPETKETKVECDENGKCWRVTKEEIPCPKTEL